MVTGWRILIKDQADGKENGIYIVAASGAPSRSSDASTGSDLVSAAMFVQRGTANHDVAFVCTNDSITIGSTVIVFTGFASLVGALLAASNLSDLTNVALARTNLGLAAVAASGSATDLTTGTLSSGRLPAFSGGDVTSSAGSAVLALVNIPSATPAAGSLLVTAIAAPATPASGKGSVYVDSTSKALAVKNDAGTVSHTVQTKAATTNQFLTAISDAGVVSAAQPASTDLSDGTAAGIAIFTGANAGAQRTSLGLGSLATVSSLTGIVTSTGAATSIANGAIAIAKLANGTAGNLITWDASGVIAAVATGSAGEVLTSNGAGAAPTFQPVGGGDALTSNPLSQFANTTSAQLAGIMTDETGTGALVFATSCTLVTPVLGVASATTINKITITAPASGATLTIDDGFTLHVSGNATISGTHTGASSGTNTGDVANTALTTGHLGQFANTTSAQLAGIMTDETGSGALVFATSCTLVTPTLGVAAATTINKITITAPASGATLTIDDGFTLHVSGNATVSGTHSGTSSGTNTGDVANTALTTGDLSQFASTTSAQLKTLISDETGSGALVFATSCTLVTPILGVATATTINKVTITAPASSATLTIADGKTLTVSNDATVSGTHSGTSSGTNTGDQTVSTMGASGALTDGTGTLLIGHGGTSATTAVGAIDALSTKSSNIASASTTDLSTATGTLVHITGTTTITALGTCAAGVERILVFDGVLVLTHNATTLILPGAASINTAAGDVAIFRSEGSGNWRCTNYVHGAFAPYGGSTVFAGTTITATLPGNDVVVTGFADAVLLNTTVSSYGICGGIAGGVDGKIIFIHNLATFGAGPLQLTPEETASAAANRFSSNNGTIFLYGKDSCMLRYSGTALRWEALVYPGQYSRGDDTGTHSGSASGAGAIQFCAYNPAGAFAATQDLFGTSPCNLMIDGGYDSLQMCGIKTNRRMQEALGTDTASANDLTLPGWVNGNPASASCAGAGNSHHITGTTTINRILAGATAAGGWQAGSRITLIFDGTLILTDGTASGSNFYGFKLKGRSSRETHADLAIDLVFDGSWWIER